MEIQFIRQTEFEKVSNYIRRVPKIKIDGTTMKLAKVKKKKMEKEKVVGRNEIGEKFSPRNVFGNSR